MSIARVNCFTAGCSNCERAIMVKKNYWGEQLYICDAYQKKHKEIDARDCGNFRCDGNRHLILCKKCRKGR